MAKLKTPAEHAVKKNSKLNLTKLVDGLAKIAAYLVLFSSSAYGLRHLLTSLQDSVSVVITVLFTLALVYILFRQK
jgi:hypothetical protein